MIPSLAIERRSLAALFSVLLALASGTIFVGRNFPDYLPGYLIQIPAVLVGFCFFSQHRITTYDRTQRLTLLLVFLAPLENTFLLKAFRKAFLDQHLLLELLRPSNILLAFLVAYILFTGRRASSIPTLIKTSFFLGAAGWILSIFASFDALQSIATGYFQFLTPFMALFLFLSVTDKQTFVLDAITIFVASCTLVSISLIGAALFLDQTPYAPTLFPFLSEHFGSIKRDIPFLMRIGGNGYENPDFYISLWVMLIPFLAGAYYASRKPQTILALSILLYAGFLQYSRAGIATVVVALIALVIIRLIVEREWSWLPTILIGVILFSNFDSNALFYFASGLETMLANIFPGMFTTNLMPYWHTSIPDQSGYERIMAWRLSFKIFASHWVTGIGFGTYPSYVSSTPPHSLLLYRLAEGGILSGISVLLLAIFGPLQLIKATYRRDPNCSLTIAAALALSSYMLKAFLFDASFALMGITVWGICAALLLTLIVVEQAHVVASKIQSTSPPQ